MAKGAKETNPQVRVSYWEHITIAPELGKRIAEETNGKQAGFKFYSRSKKLKESDFFHQRTSAGGNNWTRWETFHPLSTERKHRGNHLLI